MSVHIRDVHLGSRDIEDTHLSHADILGTADSYEHDVHLDVAMVPVFAGGRGATVSRLIPSALPLKTA
jgi:hypothetical protein